MPILEVCFLFEDFWNNNAVTLEPSLPLSAHPGLFDLERRKKPAGKYGRAFFLIHKLMKLFNFY
jgi:hypothetical protein